MQRGEPRPSGVVQILKLHLETTLELGDPTSNAPADLWKLCLLEQGRKLRWRRLEGLIAPRCRLRIAVPFRSRPVSIGNLLPLQQSCH
jgi:hypothetical protein